MTKSTNGGGGLSLSFTAKEDIQICIQSAVFTEYLITEHDFDPGSAAKMAEDFGVPPENVRFDDFGI